MISYYKSKHPGLFIYIALVCASVLSFLFLDTNASHIGILSILWGAFILMRTLSLYEIEEHANPLSDNIGASKANNSNTADLPHDLLKKMSNKNHLKRGVLAMNSLNIRTTLWFAIAIIFLSYHIVTLQSSQPLNILIQDITGFFIIGAAFWTGQTYAYSNQASKLMLLTFGILLCITILKLNINIDTSFIFEYSAIIKNQPLSILAIYSAAIFIYAFASGLTYGINAFIGLAMLTLLSICTVNIEAEPQYIALWIIGWSIISIFWVRSYSQVRRKYTLYQCE